MTMLAEKVPPDAAPVSRPASRRHRGRWLAGVFLVAMAGGTVWFQQTHRGMWSGMVNQMRYGTLQENWNLGRCNFYWLTLMQKLTRDPATGAYNFKHTSEQGMDLE